jgi:hypothetical protein
MLVCLAWQATAEPAIDVPRIAKSALLPGMGQLAVG